MHRIIFTITVLITASAVAFADPTPDIKSSFNSQNNMLSVLDMENNSLYTGDVYMPTLEEMLGEPVDNLGDIVDNQWLKDPLPSRCKRAQCI